MRRQGSTKNPIELHLEMYEHRRCEIAWLHGRTLREVLRDMSSKRLIHRQPSIQLPRL